jgi:hypothetical protein
MDSSKLLGKVLTNQDLQRSTEEIPELISSRKDKIESLITNEKENSIRKFEA